MDTATDLDLLLQIQERALQATGLEELRFTIVNETNALTPYRQAVLFERHGSTAWQMVAASGLVSVANDSPFAVWLNAFAQRWPSDGQMHQLDFDAAGPQDAPGWEEWLPDHLLLVPLKTVRGRLTGLVMLAKESPWTSHEMALLSRLHVSYAHCMELLLTQHAGRWRARSRLVLGKHRWKFVLAALLLLCVPVRMSVLAPAEVIALDAVQVAAPQDGVIGTFAVAPNARVKQGELLFSLDDATVINRRQVAQKSLEVARADALVAQQRAFDDARSKADVAIALGRVREKEAELAAIDDQAQRIEVRADRDGVAVYADPNDWIGKPVQVGERVLQLAQPEDAGVLIWMAVPDAINLELDAPVRLFLHTDPLRPLDGVLVETSYQAVRSPDDVAAYRLRARLESQEGDRMPRIGLRGTARISGRWVPMAYYLFRRPLAALREWTGL